MFCAYLRTAQLLLQLYIVLYQRQLLHMTVNLQKKMASKLQIEEVLQQINDEQWCDSDDDCLDDDQDENDDFSRLEDPLDKAGAGNEEDDEDDEIPDNTTSPLSPESVSILPCSTPPDLPASSTIPDPIHMPTASTVDQVPTNSSSQPLFTPVPGPKVTLEDDSQPYDYFCQIWGCDTFKFIAEQTNLYATQKGTSPWENVSEDEMKAFFGIQVSMGLVRLPSLHDYWSTNPLIGTPGIVKGMSRKRFRSILSHLHLNDNSRMPQPGSPEFDKLYKVRPLLDRIRANSQAAYQPHQQIAVDEAMVLFKGRSAMRQYMPKKPVKWGYKCWCACDATNGFMYNVDVYQGAGSTLDEAGLGATVVLHMMVPLYDCNHHVYTDNFFSSISLANKVKDHGADGTYTDGSKITSSYRYSMVYNI